MRLRWRRENAEQSSTGLASSSPIARPDDTDARAESIAVTADAGQAARGDADETGWDEPEYLTVLVRPYVWTGGRVLSNDDLPLETLISTNQRRGTRDVEANPPEWRVIVEMCAGPRSVAEVAAALHMPLGIARVVIKDMADDGTIIVHRTAGAAGNGPDRELLLRIRDGLRRL